MYTAVWEYRSGTPAIHSCIDTQIHRSTGGLHQLYTDIKEYRWATPAFTDI